MTNKNLVTISCNTALSANVDALMERLGTHNRPELFKLGLYALAQQLAQAENCETPPSLAEVQENLRRLVPGAGSFRAFCGRKEEAAKPAAKKPLPQPEPLEAPLLLPIEERALPLLLPGEGTASPRLRHISRFTYELQAFVGWRVLIYRGEARFQRYFSDIQYGGTAPALHAALEARAQVFEALNRWPDDPQRAFDSVPGGRRRSKSDVFSKS